MSTDEYLITAGVAGVIIGLAFSAYFTKYASVNSYIATIAGMNSNTIITTIVFVLVIAGIIGLASMAIIIKDTEYITKNPFGFAMETILMGILPVLAFMFVIFDRSGKTSISGSSELELGLLTFKFSSLHVLLQLSGYYRYLFS